jgi:hypothetical protein
MTVPVTPPTTPAYHRALRLLAVAMAALVMQIPYAQAQQHKTPGAGPSDKQKAHDAEVRAYEKATDKAYRETLKQIPDGKPNADPWGNLRPTPPK